MAGEDLLEDDTGTGAAAKGKKKPLSKGQKIGLGIGIVTILLIIYQVRKQSAASASSSSATQPIDPATGYPSGSAQDQAALQAMQGSSASGSGYTGGGSGWSSAGATPTDTVPGDLASFFSSLPLTSPLSPQYVPPASSPQATPTINISVPPPDVVVNPASTTGSQGGASITNNNVPQATTLQSIIASIDPSHTSYSSGGKTYYGIGNTNDLTQIDAAAKKAGINVTQTNAKAIGIKGGSTSAVYIA